MRTEPVLRSVRAAGSFHLPGPERRRFDSILRAAALLSVVVPLTAVTSSRISPAHAGKAHGRTIPTGRHHVRHRVRHTRGCRSLPCDRRVGRSWWIRHHPRPAAPQGAVALASWFNDAGGTACETHATYGFADRTLPCGTQVTFQAVDDAGHAIGPVVTGEVEDRGPFIAGREFDLNPTLKSALACSDLCKVRYRIG
jgi:hypothetical protein